MAAYPHHLVQVREDSFGIAVFSKKPLLDKAIWIIGEVPLLDVTIQYRDQSIRIVNWHPLPPRSPSYVRIWRAQYDDLFRRLADHNGPLLIIGDFNATQHARNLQKIALGGMRSAHEQTDRGYAVTFPNGTSLTPPIRLDHVMMSDHWECADISEGVGAGSDHKPLIADLVLSAE
jgi:endonuclease/exonuclease/phosphatase (EEP) superfamily protein YafD